MIDRAFFAHPLWQKFQGRAVTVCRLSDGEHKLRDAYATILLKEYLPPDTRFMTFVVDRKNQPALGGDREGGLVILGRPSLFPQQVRSLLDELKPPLLYRFESDSTSNTKSYRSIVRTGLLREDKRRSGTMGFAGKSFGEQEGGTLSDNAIVYSGWRGSQPVMVLAGSSTVGTWGAAHYVTKAAEVDEPAIWQQDVQGIVQAQVASTGDGAFDEVRSKSLEMLSPARFWLEGGDRPPAAGWTRKDLQLERVGGPEKFDLRVVINGKQLSTKRATFVSALVLLAWLSHRVDEYRDGFVAEVTSVQVIESLFRYLHVGPDDPLDLGKHRVVEPKISSDRRRREPEYVETMAQFKGSKIGRHVCEILQELTAAIRAAGGIADAIENEHGRSDEAKWRFRLVSRALPHFFPALPRAER